MRIFIALKFRYFIFLLALFLAASSSSLTAQVLEEEMEPEEDYGPPPKLGYRYNFMVEVHAPHNILNEANRIAWRGIVGGSVKWNFTVARNFKMGVFARGVGYTTFLPNYPYNPDDTNRFFSPYNITLTGGINFTYEVRMGQQFAFIPDLNVGYSWIRYNGLYDITKGGTFHVDGFGLNVNFNAGFYYYVRSNKKFAIGLLLGGNFFTHKFNLAETSLNYSSMEELQTANDRDMTVHLNVGFGILMNFTRIRS